MEALPYPVARIVADQPITLRNDILFHGMPYVSDGIAAFSCIDCQIEGSFRNFKQPRSAVAYESDGKGASSIPIISVDADSHVDAHNIAFDQNSLIIGNAVNYLIVDGDAYTTGKGKGCPRKEYP